MRANGAAASGSEENADDFLGCINIPLNVSSNSALTVLIVSVTVRQVILFAVEPTFGSFLIGDPGRWL